MYFPDHILGTLPNISGAGTDATITTNLIPPWNGPLGSAPLICDPRPTGPSANRFAKAITHLTSVNYTNGDTAHVLTLMRPKNYTWLTTAIAANGTALVPYDDPGVYSTNYKYPTPAGFTTGTAQVADNAIATNDWVCLQLKDGTWHKSMIASGTFGGGNLVLTTAVPNVTGGGAAVGAPVYFFGIPTDKDPATGLADINTSVAAVATSGVNFAVWSYADGFFSALHYGDPLLFHDPGTTHLGTLNYITGYYARW